VPGVLNAGPYLNVEILVDFHSIAKEENVLHQTSKLPHVPQVLQCFGGLGGHLWLCGLVELGLMRRALEARHLERSSLICVNSEVWWYGRQLGCDRVCVNVTEQ
jgi:hypothetical protein